MARSMQTTTLAIAILVLQFAHPADTQSSCPWDSPGLLPWSDPNSWPSGAVPETNAQVDIPMGKRILLNIQPPSLDSITIHSGAALIWGDVEGIVLRAQSVLIEGEFHVGSSTCRFNKKARIKLYGLSNSTSYSVEFGRKFIGVAPGGLLELHGQMKTSWTRLAQTIPAKTDIPCGTVYDHSDYEKNPFARERQAGLHVIIWNGDGTVFDFAVFNIFTDIETYFTTVPNGTVVGMFTFGADGVGSRAQTGLRFDKLDSLVTTLGGRLITSVDKGDSYSFVARKGSRDGAKEFYQPRGQVNPAPLGYLHLPDWTRGLDFQVASSSAENFKFFQVVSTDAAYPKLTLAEEVTGWSVGDEIVVASTDFDWHQAEVRSIIQCPSCSPREIRVNDSFLFMHYGNFTYNVDERAEVGLLSRSIVIEGEMEKECYFNNALEMKLCQRFNKDTFGGHVKMNENGAMAHIEGVELYHMGQQSLKGFYPLHFHMGDEAPGAWLRDNSIHHSFSRCVTIHATDGVEVSSNVCYDHLGHGFYLEDSVEQNTNLTANLGIGSQHGTLLMSDMTKPWCLEDFTQRDFSENCDELSTFWLTHPNNEVVGNVAAGSDGHGFMYVFADVPLGPSFYRQQVLGKVQNFSSRFVPLKRFDKNVAHSNQMKGLFFDSKISTGRLQEENGIPESGVIQTSCDYDPRSPPDQSGQRIWVEMTRCTFYKNVNDNAWVKGGNVRMTYSSLADSPVGVAGGNAGPDVGIAIYKSIFIGQTENKGTPLLYRYSVPGTSLILTHQFDQSFAGKPTDTLAAFALYQGPNIIKDCYFDRYSTWFWNDTWASGYGSRPARNGGAISWKRSNTYPTMTSTYVANVMFGYCDGENGGNWVFHGNSSTSDWVEMDGNREAYVGDSDGSLTGYPNMSVVKNIPIYLGPECVYRPTWGMSVCPYRYIKMEILGDSGNLGPNQKNNYPLIIRRIDAPYNEPLSLRGDIRNEFLLRTSQSYLVDFNNSRTNAAFSRSITVFGFGVEIGDVVRVGICQPTDVEAFTIRSDYPAVIRGDPVWASSLAELDADTNGNVFFHDKTNGILFFKILSHHLRTNESQRCPEGLCYKIRIDLIGGSLGNVRSCADVPIPPFVNTNPTPTRPVPKPCNGRASPEGLGAVDWNEVKFVSRSNFTIPCHFPDPLKRGPVIRLGCFDMKYYPELKDSERAEFLVSLTYKLCSDRCFNRGYAFAALSKGKRCTCGSSFNTTLGATPASDCNLICTGSKVDTCGATWRFDVLSTGLL